MELSAPIHAFPFDLERAIDDWVFLIFFVGNDFLPHLPSLEIREGAIDVLMGIWKSSLERMGGYLAEHGKVNLTRAQLILEGLASREDEIFRKRREGVLAVSYLCPSAIQFLTFVMTLLDSGRASRSERKASPHRCREPCRRHAHAKRPRLRSRASYRAFSSRDCSSDSFDAVRSSGELVPPSRSVISAGSTHLGRSPRRRISSYRRWNERHRRRSA